MKLSLAANLVVNWVCRVLSFPECIQPITAAALCTVAINVLVPRAFNPESQYFIPWFNKVSWLCRQRPRGDEESNEGCNSGPTGHHLTDNSIFQHVTGPWTYSLKQLPGNKELRSHFLVTLIKRHTTLFPNFYRWLMALQRTFWLLHKRQSENRWLKFVCQNLKISWPAFIERKIAPQAFLGKRLLTMHLLQAVMMNVVERTVR